jgi:hypothetical protein
MDDVNRKRCGSDRGLCTLAAAMPDVAPLSTFLMLAISFCGTLAVLQCSHRRRSHTVFVFRRWKSGLVKEIRLLFHKNVTNSGEYVRIG